MIKQEMVRLQDVKLTQRVYELLPYDALVCTRWNVLSLFAGMTSQNEQIYKNFIL